MLAIALTLALFGFWLYIGHAVLTLIYRHNDPLHNLLLAPVVGMSTLLLPLFWCSRLGFPIKDVALPITVALAILSGLIRWRRTSNIPWRRYWPFLTILLVGLALACWPMFEFGFDWIGLGNSDVSGGTAPSAHRLLNYGFLTPPNTEYFQGLDYSQRDVLRIIDIGHRAGSQVILAWVMALTKLPAYPATMPTLGAFHLSLLSATGALASQNGKQGRLAILTVGVLSCSSINTYGVVNQLMDQVNGLSLLVVCTDLLLHQRFKIGQSNPKPWSYCLLVSLSICAFLIVYPQIFPFLGASVFFYIAILTLQRKLKLGRFLTLGFTSFLLCLVILNSYVFNDLWSFFYFSLEHMESDSAIIFPQYLLPSGLGNLWGLLNLGRLPPEPLLSVLILTSIVIFLCLILCSVKLSWQGQPAIIFTLVMMGSGVLLFYKQSGYGLFKLAMYVQPFLIAAIISCLQYLAQVRFKSFVAKSVLSLICAGLVIINLKVQFDYLNGSRGVSSQQVEVAGGSEKSVYRTIEEVVKKTEHEAVLIGTMNTTFSGMSAIANKGKMSLFTNFDFFYKTKENNEFSQAYRLNYEHPEYPNYIFKNFTDIDKALEDSNSVLFLTLGESNELLNRHWIRNKFIGKDVIYEPLDRVNDFLIFIPSTLGRDYRNDRETSAIFKVESDYFFSGQTMAGLGRHQLFRILNLTPGARLKIDITASLKADGGNQLPPADIIGQERQPLPLMGRGSARIFSEPIEPQAIAEGQYIAIDMGVEGIKFPESRTGLMKLYGHDVSRDPRHIVVFGRDISLVSKANYQQLEPPSRLRHFPEDLMDQNLEYSGIYEDGWLSEAAFFRLTQPPTAQVLNIEGQVHTLNDPGFTTELTIWLDGKEIGRRSLKPGEFNWQLEVPSQSDVRRIELRCSQLIQLPEPDNRPAALQLKTLEFIE